MYQAKLLLLVILLGCSSGVPDPAEAPSHPGNLHLFDVPPTGVEVTGSYVSEDIDRELRSGTVWIRGERPARGDWEIDRARVGTDGPLLLRAPTRFEPVGPARLLNWSEVGDIGGGRVIEEGEEVEPAVRSEVVVSARGLQARIDELGRFPPARPISYPAEASQVVVESIGVPPDAQRVAEPRRTEFGRKSRRTAIAPAPTELSWTVRVPPDAQLVFGYGLRSSLVKAAPGGGLKVYDRPPERPDAVGAVRFEVSIRAPGGATLRELWSREVSVASRDRFLPGKVRLRALAGTEVEVVLSTAAMPGEPLPEGFVPFWSEPILESPRDDGPPSVILLVCDTLRADALGCYGNPRDVSPNIDRLAQAGVRYADPMAEATWTLPSHASIMTSLHASQHGVLYRERIPAQAVTLAEVMRQGGYTTLAVTEGIFVTPRFGMDHGFDHFESCVWDVEKTFARAINLVGQVEGPYFLYLHTFQAHAPYESVPDLRARFVDDYSGPLGVPVTNTDHEREADELTPEDLKFIRQLYDAEVALIDRHVGVLMDSLRERGVLENTLIVLTSDHGEAFDEHGTWGHGTSVYQEQLKVPLIVYQSDRFEGGAVPDHPVHTIDIAPTIVRGAGLEVPDSWSGVELELEADAAARELVGSFLIPPWRRRATVMRRGSLKVMQFPLDDNQREDLAAGPAPVRAYDLSTDPGEERDIWEDVRTDLGFEDLEGVWTRYPGLFEMGRTRIDEDLQGQLEALGYAGDG